MSRDTKTSKAVLDAWCNQPGCPWASTAANAHGNAARHHDATGHSTTVEVHRTITYGDPSAPAITGQTDLVEELAKLEADDPAIPTERHPTTDAREG